MASILVSFSDDAIQNSNYVAKITAGLKTNFPLYTFVCDERPHGNKLWWGHIHHEIFACTLLIYYESDQYPPPAHIAAEVELARKFNKPAIGIRIKRSSSKFGYKALTSRQIELAPKTPIPEATKQITAYITRTIQELEKPRLTEDYWVARVPEREFLLPIPSVPGRRLKVGKILFSVPILSTILVVGFVGYDVITGQSLPSQVRASVEHLLNPVPSSVPTSLFPTITESSVTRSHAPTQALSVPTAVEASPTTEATITPIATLPPSPSEKSMPTSFTEAADTSLPPTVYVKSSSIPSPTWTPTVTPSQTSTSPPTPTSSATPTVTPTSTPTNRPTYTSTATSTATATHTPAPSVTFTPSPTDKPSNTPTLTPQTKLDSDHDGVPDAEDACVNVAGYVETAGCLYTGQVNVSSTFARVRVEPNTNADVVAKIGNQTEVILLGISPDGDWYYIRFADSGEFKTGWISGELIFTNDKGNLPTLTP